MTTVVAADPKTTVVVQEAQTLSILEQKMVVAVGDDAAIVQIVTQPVTVIVPPDIIVQIQNTEATIIESATQGPPGGAGPAGPPGPPGPVGPQGASGDYVVWDQPLAAAVWHITHTLGKRPSVTVVDSSHRVVLGQIDYLSDSALDVTFSAAFAGSAYLS